MNERRQQTADPLNLRSLPPVSSDHDGWPAIESALLQQRKRARAWRFGGGALAAAATVVLALALTVNAPVQENMPAAGPDSGVAATDRATQETQPLPLQEPSVESLMVMSRQLENRVRQFRDNVGDMPARELVYEVELQDLIAQVDEGLSRNPGSVELWSQRVNLLMDVASLYESNLRRDYYRIASL